MIGLSIYSQVDWRHWGLSIFGIICPWFIIFSVETYFSIDLLNSMFISDFLLKKNNSISINFAEITNLITFGLLGLISIIELIISLRKKKIKARKAYVLILWIIPLAILYYYLSQKNYNTLLIFAIPFSAIISNYFYYHKKSVWLFFLLISIFIINHILY